MTGLIVALDDPDLGRAEALAKSLADRVSALKVGLTLIAASGPEAILEVGQHAPVFVDAKLHDIPAQVAGAMRQYARLGAWLVTAHASGGGKMIAAAVEAANEADPPCIVAGVTVITSLGPKELEEVGQDADTGAQVGRLARVAVDAGARALICSPQEVASLRKGFPGVLLVVPAIRPSGEAARDQARSGTPRAAASDGADHIVVGRPITEAPDPVAAADAILEELAG